MSSDAEVTPEIRRAKDGRAYILDPDTGRERLYSRVSTFARALSDGAALEAWKLRMAYLGLQQSPGLLRSPGAMTRSAIDEAMAVAMDVAGANDAARMGTALHGLAEWVDRGESVDRATFDVARDVWDALDRYVEVTKDLKVVEVERFVVNDLLGVAGTYDRVYEIPDGRRVIGDLKTGSVLRMLEHAIQLAAYAHSKHYDLATGARSDIEGLDVDLGLIVHVPYNPTLVETRLAWVDLTKGWSMAQLAKRVRSVRSMKFDLPSPIGAASVEEEQ